MRPHSHAALFIAHIAAGIFALTAPASAATISVGADTTIMTSATGDNGADGANNSVGFAGSGAIVWDDNNVDVLLAAAVALVGGKGGNGGVDGANNGGNPGNAGGAALDMGGNSAATVQSPGPFVVTLSGGNGGNGSDGGSSGALDTIGGGGGFGGDGVYLGNASQVVTLSNANIAAGAGGSGGNAGDSASDAADNAQGGNGGLGGSGIELFGTTDALVTINNSTVKGGDGGTGGTSLVGGVNAMGGGGGAAIDVSGVNSTIFIGAGSLLEGGALGAPGTGGFGGGFGNSGGSGVRISGGSGTNLTNHGTILGSHGSGVFVLGANVASIVNYGNIDSPLGHSVLFETGADIGLFHNKAGAFVQSAGNANTVAVTGNSSITSLINEGTIENTGPGGALNLIGTVGSFSNSGLIHANELWSLLLNSPNVPDLIVNTGGTISTSGAGSAAVLIFTDLGAAAVTIDGGALQGDKALWVSAAQTGAITVKNANLVGSVEFSNSDETLNLSGSTLNGDVAFTGSGNNLNFEQGGTTTIANGAQILNTTFFSLLSGANVVSNSEQNAANSDILKLTMVTTSKLVLNEDFWVDDSTFNQGTIEIAAGKTLTANEFAGDGTYIFNITDASTLAKIEAQGAFSKIDLTGAAVEVKLTNPSAMFANGATFLLGEDLNDKDIVGIVNGAAAADNSALLTFFLYRGDAPEIGLASDLLFAKVQLLLLADIAGQGDDPNAIALGAALDTIGLDGNADLDDLMLALAQLPTNKAINDVLDALLPETDGVAYDLATDAGDQMLDVASRRLDGLRGSASASLEYRVASLSLLGLRGTASATSRSQFWGQAFGRTVDQRKHSFNDGYDAGSYGFAIGADTALDNATQLGAALSYTSTNADGNGINRTDTDVDSYQLTLYGDHLFDNATYAKGLFAFARHNNDIARHDVGGIPGNTATGSYDASTFNLRAELGRAYAGGGTLIWIPRATFNAAWYSPDGYSEQGVGGLGLTVLPDDLTSVRLGLGVLARWDMKLSGGELFQPELRLDYRRDLTQDRFETTSEFLGAPGITFRTQGVEPAADILNLGLGALLATESGIDFRASYDLELKEDYTAHAGYVRASIPF